MTDRKHHNVHAYNTQEALDKYSCYFLYPVERYLISRFFKPGDSVLDLGCGTGRTTVCLHEMGYQVKGIDISELFINCARKRFPNIPFECHDFSKLTEKENSFDHALISHNGIDYVYPESERIDTLTHCYRILKPGGYLIYSSHNITSLLFSPIYARFISRWWWKIRNTHYGLRSKAYIKDLDMYTFFASPEHVKSQTLRLGFDFIDLAGLRLSNKLLFNKLMAPYIHYVFRKPIDKPAWISN